MRRKHIKVSEEQAKQFIDLYENGYSIEQSVDMIYIQKGCTPPLLSAIMAVISTHLSEKRKKYEEQKV